VHAAAAFVGLGIEEGDVGKTDLGRLAVGADEERRRRRAAGAFLEAALRRREA
jgi:hypothetical protein